jgi:hypothetical protein
VDVRLIYHYVTQYNLEKYNWTSSLASLDKEVIFYFYIF